MVSVSVVVGSVVELLTVVVVAVAISELVVLGVDKVVVPCE